MMIALETDLIGEFEPITLREMDSVKLMNRTDTKFLFNIIHLPEILDEIKDQYRVLEVEGKRLSRYETLYYDTAEFEMYRAHHQGRLNRYKIRHRTYVESSLGFLEVKFKNNKQRTIKTRIQIPEAPEGWEESSLNFLNKMQPIDPHRLQPVIWVNYNRHTLVSKYGAERLTLDLSLQFIRNETTRQLDRLVIAEVKQDKRKHSPFMAVMKQRRIREGGISKYCMGIAMTCDAVKKNNFKNKLKTIEHKINNDHSSGS
jgi:hypothetical protein